MKPRVAMIGAGTVAELYAKAFERGVAAQVSGIFDPNRERAESLAKRLGVRAYRSL